eukprot:m.361071 g.361071  ORF g.361071 m.361071 type:complete len:918 (-) comp19313_c0_seq1:209-2962(-)
MDAQAEDVCRVCRDVSTEENPLFHPCKCTGSIRYVHEDCLVSWLESSGNSHCELCGYSFQFQKIYDDNAPQNATISDLLIGAIRLFKTKLQPYLRFAAVTVAWGIVTPLLVRYSFRWLFQEFLFPWDFESPQDQLAWDLGFGLAMFGGLVLFALSLVFFRDMVIVHNLPVRDFFEVPTNNDVYEAFLKPSPNPSPPNTPQRTRGSEQVQSDGENGESSPVVDETQQRIDALSEYKVHTVEAMLVARHAPTPIDEDGSDLATMPAHHLVPQNDPQPELQQAAAARMADIPLEDFELDEDGIGHGDADGAENDLELAALIGLEGPLNQLVDYVFAVVAIIAVLQLALGYIPYLVGHGLYRAAAWMLGAEVSDLSTAGSIAIVYVAAAFLFLIFAALSSPRTYLSIKWKLQFFLQYFKVLLSVIVELIFMPIAAAFCLLYCSRPLTGIPLGYMVPGPNSDLPMHYQPLLWLAGMAFLQVYVSMISKCRSEFRDGVIWFFRDPHDPDFNLIKILVETTPLHHIARFTLVCVLDFTTIGFLLYVPMVLVRAIGISLPLDVQLDKTTVFGLHLWAAMIVAFAVQYSEPLYRVFFALVRQFSRIVGMETYMFPSDVANPQSPKPLQVFGLVYSCFLGVSLCFACFFGTSLTLGRLVASALQLGDMTALTLGLPLSVKLVETLAWTWNQLSPSATDVNPTDYSELISNIKQAFKVATALALTTSTAFLFVMCTDISAGCKCETCHNPPPYVHPNETWAAALLSKSPLLASLSSSTWQKAAYVATIFALITLVAIPFKLRPREMFRNNHLLVLRPSVEALVPPFASAVLVYSTSALSYYYAEDACAGFTQGVATLTITMIIVAAIWIYQRYDSWKETVSVFLQELRKERYLIETKLLNRDGSTTVTEQQTPEVAPESAHEPVPAVA